MMAGFRYSRRLVLGSFKNLQIEDFLMIFNAVRGGENNHLSITLAVVGGTNGVNVVVYVHDAHGWH